MCCLPVLGTGGDAGRVCRAKWHTRCDVRLQRQLTHCLECEKKGETPHFLSSVHETDICVELPGHAEAWDL